MSPYCPSVARLSYCNTFKPPKSDTKLPNGLFLKPHGHLVPSVHVRTVAVPRPSRWSKRRTRKTADKQNTRLITVFFKVNLHTSQDLLPAVEKKLLFWEQPN
ncbi:unnamed protein product [Arctogadus glacialis]